MNVSIKSSDSINISMIPEGPMGLSAYEIYVKNGGTLSEQEWLESLKIPVNIDEYFEKESNVRINSDNPICFLKKVPPIIIKNTDSLAYGFDGYNQKLIPKIICDNNINNFNSLYHNCKQASEIDVSGLDTSNARTLSRMFEGCKSIKELNLSSFDTSNVVYMDYIFLNCSNLENIDMSSFDTSNVINMSGMFMACESITELDLSNFDTSNVSSVYTMFANCSNLLSLDLSNFTFGKLTSFANVFNGCKRLESLNISNFDTTNITSMSNLFTGCISLKHLDIRKFVFDNVNYYDGMFGYSYAGFVPDDCEIIVKDNNAKQWLLERFSRFTNIKTVAELEENNG